MPDQFEYKIIKTYGVISSTKTGWTKELNLISWNGKEPRIDIRDWSPEHEKMGKGITLSTSEAKNLNDLLNNSDIEW
ncbi:MAG: hypothetical protein LBU04_06010 [Christensenellaceae bacterium]|jgi:hypothetical protein|nr:hypothetical protein [Christensenellaceae bacterium]